MKTCLKNGKEFGPSGMPNTPIAALMFFGRGFSYTTPGKPHMELTGAQLADVYYDVGAGAFVMLPSKRDVSISIPEEFRRLWNCYDSLKVQPATYTRRNFNGQRAPTDVELRADAWLNHWLDIPGNRQKVADANGSRIYVAGPFAKTSSGIVLDNTYLNLATQRFYVGGPSGADVTDKLTDFHKSQFKGWLGGRASGTDASDQPTFERGPSANAQLAEGSVLDLKEVIFDALNNRFVFNGRDISGLLSEDQKQLFESYDGSETAGFDGSTLAIAAGVALLGMLILRR